MGQWRVAQVVFRNLPRSLETTDYSAGPECVTLWHHKNALRSRECCYFLNIRPMNHVNSQIFLSTSNYLSPEPSTIICSSPTSIPSPSTFGEGARFEVCSPLTLGGLLNKLCLFCKAQHPACCIHQENETHWTTEADLTQLELNFLAIWKRGPACGAD